MAKVTSTPRNSEGRVKDPWLISSPIFISVIYLFCHFFIWLISPRNVLGYNLKFLMNSFCWSSVYITSVQFSCLVMSDSLRPHELQHTRPPCPSPTPGVYSNLCPLNWWYYPTILSSVIPFFSCLQSFPESGSFQLSQLFTPDGQSVGISASASVLPMNIQDWFPLGWTGWISWLREP